MIKSLAAFMDEDCICVRADQTEIVLTGVQALMLVRLLTGLLWAQFHVELRQ